MKTLFAKRNLGWFAIILLALFPLLPWAFTIPLSFRFANFNSTLTSFGQIASLTGMALFSLSFVLSTRVGPIEDWFGGMNRVYVAHHLFGGVSFILLMLHPLFLAAANLPISLTFAAQFLLPSTNWQNNLGMAALLTLMMLLTLTFFVNLPYQIWKLTHKFMGLAFFLGFLHVFFIPSDIARDPLLRSYMLILIGLGFSGYIHRTLLGKYLVKKHKFNLKAIKMRTNNIVEMSFTPVNFHLDFLPGQFTFIEFSGPGVSHEIHPFSISSSPFAKEFTLTAKSLGDFTNELPKLSPGTSVLVEGPFGRFCYYLTKNKYQVWIAGGIGITPFMSMARTLDPSYHIDLYYTVTSEIEAVYKDELATISAKNPFFQFRPWFTKSSGRLTAFEIAKQSITLADKDVFICGPPPMMYSLKQQFKKLGVPGRKIHTEEFELL